MSAVQETVTQTRLSALPAYWQRACEQLRARDRVLKRLIPACGTGHLQSRGDAFGTLARAIISQQITHKAAQSAWERFAAAQGGCVTPAQVLRLEVAGMRAAGLSQRKADYLLDLARHFDGGLLRLPQWPQMEDEAIIADLTAVRGIGRWTAEMFLMHHLLRPNVLPLDDAGLLKGISVNYFSGEPVSRAEAREVASAWAPWRSVATWYMWRSLTPVPVVY